MYSHLKNPGIIQRQMFKSVCWPLLIRLNVVPGFDVFYVSPIPSNNSLNSKLLGKLFTAMLIRSLRHTYSPANTKLHLLKQTDQRTHSPRRTHTNTHLSIETYGCGNKMHNFLFISRTCEGPSELRGHIDFPSFHAVTLGLPIFSFIFKDNS